MRPNQMKKIVVKLNSVDNKQNPMQAVSSIKGIVSMELNTNDSKITIVGDVDPILVVKKLRKWFPKIETVGPAKEEKKEDDKKEVSTEQEPIVMYHRYIQPYFIQSCDQNPNACVIC